MPPSITALLAPRGILSRALPGWEPRPAQLAMAEAVGEALRTRRPLLVQAGTGTGKTIAYLVPAILSGLKVVVSTGTKNLQEQLLKKDLPLLRDALPLDFRVAGLKGMANYLCRRRLGEHERTWAARGEDPPELVRLREWVITTETGDRAEIGDLADDAPLWAEVGASPETRIGTRCPHVESCFVSRARREAQQADLLVVNHHLFFADLALRSEWPQAALLPAYEAVIFDEAHQLEAVATDYFGRAVSSLRLAAFGRDAGHAVAAHGLEAKIERMRLHLERVAEDLWRELGRRIGGDRRVAGAADLWQGAPTRAWLAVDTALEEIGAACGAMRVETAEGQETCASLGRRAASLRADLALCGDRTNGDFVYWAEQRGRSVFLHASPIDVSERLRQRLVGDVEALIFTSATLAVSGSFDYVRSRLGLEAATELALEAPFDYASQALLYVPEDLPEPRQPGFTAATAARMRALVEASAGSAFLLFTTHRQMVATHRLLAADLGYPTLLQGERPKHLLLEAFRERPSVLFATASFWEGVDVVGEALRLVVIDKLPFAPPDDPLVAARIARLEDEGRDGFSSYQLPQAALALAQGFGRLIRHRGDYGVVALLDKRAATRRYGETLLGALPVACPRTASLSDVAAFFAARLPAAERERRAG